MVLITSNLFIKKTRDNNKENYPGKRNIPNSFSGYHSKENFNKNKNFSYTHIKKIKPLKATLNNNIQTAFKGSSLVNFPKDKFINTDKSGEIKSLVHSQKNQVSFKGEFPAPPKKVMEELGTVGKTLVNSLWYPKGLIHKITKFVRDIPALGEALFILGITTTIRPATVLTVPGPKKADRKYAAAHSISTGIVTFAFGLLLFKPLANSAKRLATLALKTEKRKIMKELAGIDLIKSLKKAIAKKDVIEKKKILRKIVRKYKEIELKASLGKALKKIIKNNEIQEAAKSLEKALGRPVQGIIKRSSKTINTSQKEVINTALEKLPLKPEQARVLKKVIQAEKIQTSQLGILKDISKEMKPDIEKIKPLNSLEKKYNIFNYLSGFTVKYITAPLYAFMLITFISPIVKTIFPKNSYKKTAKHAKLPLPFAVKLDKDNQNIFQKFINPDWRVKK